MKKMLKLCENLPKIWKKFAKKLTQMGRKQRKFIKNHETVLKIDLKYEKKNHRKVGKNFKKMG